MECDKKCTHCKRSDFLGAQPKHLVVWAYFRGRMDQHDAEKEDKRDRQHWGFRQGVRALENLLGWDADDFSFSFFEKTWHDMQKRFIKMKSTK